MTSTTNRIVVIIAIILFVVIFGMIIYSGKTTDSVSRLNERLQKVTPDSLARILILPKNPDWRINLTLDTVEVTDWNELENCTRALNSMHEDYPTKLVRDKWEAILVLDYRTGKDIELAITDAPRGLCVNYTNVMGLHKFLCNDLKLPLERVTNFHVAVGRQHY